MSMNNQGRPTGAGDPNRRRPIAPGTVTPEVLALRVERALAR